MNITKRTCLRPISSRIFRRAFPFQAIEETAVEKKIVCHAEERALKPPLFLDGQLEKITGVHEFSIGLDDEIRKATGQKAYDTETIAFHLKDVCLANGLLCSYTHYKKLTSKNIRVKPATIDTVMHDAALCSTAAGNDYFSHFLYDNACSALMAKNFATPVFANIGHKRTAHELDYLSLLEIDIPDLNSVFFKNLWIFKDIGLNSHRRKRLHQMRAQIANSVKSTSTPGVYIKRGNNGTYRHLANEAEVEHALRNKGFDIIDPCQLSVNALATRLNGCSLVVGVEGSHLMHGLLNLKPHGTLLCIQPPDRFNAIYRPFSDAVDLHWAFIVGDGNRESFSVSIPDLLTTIDRSGALS